MKNLFVMLLAIYTCSSVMAQTKMVKVPLTTGNLTFPEGTVHSFETIDGKNTLVLNGRAQVKAPLFTNGTLEVEVHANSKRSFAGITFRKQDNTFEEVYIRMHKSGSPDALQYNPVFNVESNWQLYPEHQAAVTTKSEGWNTLKVTVKDDIAEVYVNGEKAMTVPDLKTDFKEGNIGLFALFENRFANLQVSNGQNVSDIEKPTVEPIKGLITAWELSEPNTYVPESFDDEKIEDITYSITGKSEDSGLLTISKYIAKPSSGNYRRNNEDYVVAATTIHSNTEETQLFSFDYSDKILVYLNGELLFSGNNGFLFKGSSYSGNLNINTNTIPLRLNKGENILQCVVIERANGWGLMGKINKAKF